MNTNIISLLLSATVTFSFRTNVTTGDNHWVDMSESNLIFATYPPTYGKPIDHPATERWTTTNIYSVRTLIFDWFGRRELIEETLMSSVTNREMFKGEWLPSTNTPPASPLVIRWMSLTPYPE